MPAPAWILASAMAKVHVGEQHEALTGIELACFSWLFNGPRAASARAALLPPTPVRGGNGIGRCCAAFFNRERHYIDAVVGLQEDCDICDGLVSSVAFDIALLARNLRSTPRYLEDALAAGAESWELCATSLRRIAHDFAADVAGRYGRCLPLLCIHSDYPGDHGGRFVCSAETVALVPDGPSPLVVGQIDPLSDASLGALRPSPGMTAWLRLCRPAALWMRAGVAREFILPEVKHIDACVSETNGAQARIGMQVAEALHVALAVNLTEQMVSEVWETLSESALGPTLLRRAGGSWTLVGQEFGTFVL